MQNPNQYNDEDFSRYSTEADLALQSLWEAGASLGDVETCVQNALENAEIRGVMVTITTEGSE